MPGRLDQLRKRFPQLAEYSDEEIADAAAPALGGVDKAVKYLGIQRDEPGLGTSIDRGLYGLPAGAGRAMQDVGQAFGMESVESAGRGLRRSGEAGQFRNPRGVNDFSEFAERPWLGVREAIGEGIGTTLPGIAAAFIPGVGPAAAFGIGAGAAAMSSYGGIRKIQDQTGFNSPMAAAGGALAVGGIEQALGVQRLFRPTSGRQLGGIATREEMGQMVSSPMRTFGLQSGKVSLQEGAEELVQGPIEQFAGGQNPADHMGETAFGAFQGVIGGLVPFGLGSGARRAMQQRSARSFADENFHNPSVALQSQLDAAEMQRQFIANDQGPDVAAQWYDATLGEIARTHYEGMQAAMAGNGPVNLLNPASTIPTQDWINQQTGVGLQPQPRADAKAAFTEPLQSPVWITDEAGNPVLARSQYELYDFHNRMNARAPNVQAPVAGEPMAAFPHQGPGAMPANVQGAEDPISRAAGIIATAQQTPPNDDQFKRDLEWAHQTLQTELGPKLYKQFVQDLGAKAKQTPPAAAPKTPTAHKAVATPQAPAPDTFAGKFKAAGGKVTAVQKALDQARSPEEALEVVRQWLEHKSIASSTLKALEQLHKDLSGKTYTQHLQEQEAAPKGPAAPGAITTYTPEQIAALNAGTDKTGVSAAPTQPNSQIANSEQGASNGNSGQGVRAGQGQQAARPVQVQPPAVGAQSARAEGQGVQEQQPGPVTVPEDDGELTHWLMEQVGARNKRMQVVLENHLGIGDGNRRSEEEVARELGISGERVRQIRNQALGVARDLMQEHKIDPARLQSKPQESPDGPSTTSASSFGQQATDAELAPSQQADGGADAREGTGFKVRNKLNEVNSDNLSSVEDVTANKETRQLEKARETGDRAAEAAVVWDNYAHHYAASGGERMRSWDDLAKTPEGQKTQAHWVAFYEKLAESPNPDVTMAVRIRRVIRERYYTKLSDDKFEQDVGELTAVRAADNPTLVRALRKRFSDGSGSLVKDRLVGYFVSEHGNGFEAMVVQVAPSQYVLVTSPQMWNNIHDYPEELIERAFQHEIEHTIDDAAQDQGIYSADSRLNPGGDVRREIMSKMSQPGMRVLFAYPLHDAVRMTPERLRKELHAQIMSAYHVPAIRGFLERHLPTTYLYAQAKHEKVVADAAAEAQQAGRELRSGQVRVDEQRGVREGLQTRGFDQEPQPALDADVAQAINLEEEFEADVDAALNEDDKQRVAFHFDAGKWSKAVSDRFIQEFATWRATGAKASHALADLFRKVVRFAGHSMLSIAAAVNFSTVQISEARATQLPVTTYSVTRALETPKADFKGVEAPAAVRLVADWQARKGGAAFIVVDKPGGLLYAFDASGSLLAKTPALTGKTVADVYTEAQKRLSLAQTTDKDKVTPAGEFASKGVNSGYGKSVEFSHFGTSRLLIHSVYLGTPSERRAERLSSPTGEDNRVSYGCINVPAEFVKDVLEPHFMGASRVVVMPETMSVEEMFPDVKQPTVTEAVTTGVSDSDAAVSWGAEKYGLAGGGRGQQRRASQRRSQFSKGDVITFRLPWVKDKEYLVTGVVGESVEIDDEGRVVDDGTGSARVNVTYNVEGESVTNSFGQAQLAGLVTERHGRSDSVLQSRGLSENIDDAANVLGQAQQRTITKLGDLWAKSKPTLLTLHQLVDQYGSKLSSLVDYVASMGKMEQRQQERTQRAHKVILDWQALHGQTKHALDFVMQRATLRGIHPDEAYGPGTPNEHLQDRAEYDALKARYNALAPEAKAVYKAVRSMLDENWQARKAAFSKATTAAYKKLIDDVQGDPAKVASLTKERDKHITDHARTIASLKGPYFPLSRFGEYLVIGQSKELAALQEQIENATGSTRTQLQKRIDAMKKDANHYRVEAHESRFEAEKATRLYNGRGLVARTQLAEEHVRALQPVAAGAVDKISDSLSSQFDKVTAGKMKRLLTDLYISSLPEHAALQRQLRRKGVEGATEDMLRAVAQAVEKDSFHLSRLEFADEVSDALFKLKQQAKAAGVDYQHVYNNLTARVALDFEYEATPIQNFFARMSGIWHLGMSPAYLLTNSTQPWMITAPVMAGKFGAQRSFSALTSAWVDAARIIKQSKKGGAFADVDLTAIADRNERDAMQRIMSRGQIDINQNMDMGLVADGTDPKFLKAQKVFNWANHHVEASNRITTGLAAYRLARTRMSHDQAADYALKMVVDTQLDYSNANAAYWMKNGAVPLGKLIFQFRKYQQGMLYLLARNAQLAWKGDKDAMRALGYLSVMQLAMAGAVGIPVVTAPLAAFNFFFGDDDDEEGDTETKLRNYLTDMMGADAARAFWKGLPTLLGVDVSKRVGMGDLWNPVPYLRLTGKTGQEDIGQAIMSVGGAALGMAGRMWDSKNMFEQGDWVKGTEKLLPKVLADLVKGARYAEDGITTRRGTAQIEPERLDGWDIAFRAAGFSPVVESEHYAAQESKMEVSQAIDKRRQLAIQNYAQAVIKGKPHADAMEEVEKFNKAHPSKGYLINRSSLQQAVQSRRKNATQLDEAGVRFQKREQTLRPIDRYAR